MWLPVSHCKRDVIDREVEERANERESIVLCGIYYLFWVYVIPRLRGYRIRQKVVVLDNRVVTHELIQVPLAELDAWDATHDAVGHDIVSQVEPNGHGGKEEYAATKEAKKVEVGDI